MQTFESPRFLIRQTRANLAEFKSVCDAFFKANPADYVVDTDPNSGEQIHKFRFGNPLPDKARHIAATAINDMRHALDQIATISFEIVTGIDAPRSLYFPIGTNENDLRGRVRKDFPTELHSVFQMFQFKETGNRFNTTAILQDLSKAARNKHRITLNLSGRAFETSFNQIFMSAGTEFFFEPVWDTRNNEFVVARVPAGGHLHHDIQITFFVSFSDAGPIDGFEVMRALTDLCDAVEWILDTVEGEVSKILSVRT